MSPLLYVLVHRVRLCAGQSGTPEVSAHGEYDAEENTYKLTLKQSSKNEGNLPFHIPVVVGLLLKENGSEVGLCVCVCQVFLFCFLLFLV